MNLFGAIDNMLFQSKTPHFMQMHTGDIDMGRIQHFADAHSSVEAFQALEFLNIDGAEIGIGGNSLAWSVQDNGFSTQSGEFDFLLDLNGDVIRPSDGEIYVPIYYMREGAAKLGDTVTTRGILFTVAGFSRDSIMNAGLVGSKRFLVSENDYEKIRSFGIMEYLIEFRFTDDYPVSAFESDYLEANLPANGPPAVNYALMRMMNAIADGIMIAVLMLIGLLVIAVTFLCIRFTLLAKIEEDYREIGVLKAIGLSVSHIKKLYMVKYGAIAGIACVLGFMVSLLIQGPFMENMRLYMGESNRFLAGLLFGMTGAAVIFLIIMLYVNGILRRFRKISAAQAIRFGAPQEKSKSAKVFLLSRSRFLSCNVFLGVKDVLSRKKLYVTMLMVLVISSFIINVPQNIYNTISAKNFMTYIGIGECDMRIDTNQTQTEHLMRKTAEIADMLARDNQVSNYAVLICKMFETTADDGTTGRLRVELGDHTAFPITYSKGHAPQAKTEIALSTLYADDLGRDVGDTVILSVDGEDKRLTVSGIYSDVTNGGRTSKAVFETTQRDILWSSIPVAFYDGSLTDAKVSHYREMFPFAKVSGVEEYIRQTFGSAIAAVQIASYASIAVTVALTVLVTLLFMKMLVTKDRYPIAVLKSFGFTNSGITAQYKTRSVMVLILGVMIGTVLANTLGELVGAAMIFTFGASSFNFVVNPLFAYLFSPLLIAVCVYAATLLGVSDIRKLNVSEYIKEA